MKCFIHGDKEAIAVCKECGKGMCSNCSAYTGHSGICPECTLSSLTAQRYEEARTRTGAIVCSVIMTILAIIFLFIEGLAIIALAPAIVIGICVIRTIVISKRINALDDEIGKLQRALHQGTAAI